MEQNQEWMPNEPTQQTSLAEMGLLIQKLQAARDSYEAAKKASNAKYQELEEVEKEVMNTLKANGRTKFEEEGVGLAYIVQKEIYATPKTIDQKQALFEYIRQKYGPETLTNMLSINHQSLNSWCNKEVEAEPTLQIPGLDQPTSVETLNFRRKS
jgi:hypothetical protein